MVRCSSTKGFQQDNQKNLPTSGFPACYDVLQSGSSNSSYNNICTVCGKNLLFASKLKEHMRSHTGERPYKCELCSYRATQTGALRRHIRSVHHQLPRVASACQNQLATHHFIDPLQDLCLLPSLDDTNITDESHIEN